MPDPQRPLPSHIELAPLKAVSTVPIFLAMPGCDASSSWGIQRVEPAVVCICPCVTHNQTKL